MGDNYHFVEIKQDDEPRLVDITKVLLVCRIERNENDINNHLTKPYNDSDSDSDDSDSDDSDCDELRA